MMTLTPSAIRVSNCCFCFEAEPSALLYFTLQSGQRAATLASMNGLSKDS